MQNEENKNVTHLLKKRSTRIFGGDLASGLFCWQMQGSGARNHTLTANYVGTEKGCSCPFCYEPSSHVSSSSASSAHAPIQIACPAMTTRCLSNEVPTIPRYRDGVERQHCHPESWRRCSKGCGD